MNINAIFPGRKFVSSNKIEIKNLKNQLVAEMDIIPSVLVYKIRRNLLKSEYQNITSIAECFKKARSIFLNDEVDNINYNEHIKNVHTVTGLPLETISKSMLKLADEFINLPKEILEEVPNGSGFIESKVGINRSKVYWVPKGKILSVIAPGNNPLVHRSWLEALASGYKIIIRPSNRDPFTPYRLIKSLLLAGLSEDMIAFIPGEHDITDAIVEAGDYSLIFGNNILVDKYKKLNNTILRGPGYSKLYLDSTSQLSDDVVENIIVKDVLKDGGAKCSNLSGIIYNSVKKFPVESAINKIINEDSCGWLDKQGKLPLFSLNTANNLYKFLKQLKQTGLENIRFSNLDDVIIDLGDGICSIRPIVFKLSNLTEKFKNYELPFPTFWAYEINDDDIDMDFLKNTLYLDLISENKMLKYKCLIEPSIKKIVTHFNECSILNSNLPHDGYMLEKLFFAKAII